MDQDKGKDADEKRGRRCPHSCPSHERENRSATASTPLRRRSNGRRTRCGSSKRRGQRRGRATWTKHGNRCVSFSRLCRKEPPAARRSPDELKDAASAVTAILATHFPEGPKGAARAHRQFDRWLGNGAAGQTPGAARWAAAFRDIKRLESDPARPNYLAELCPCDGVDFSQIGHGLDLRGRAVARAKAKIWSALSWSTTSDGGLVLSKSGKLIARLSPDHGQRPRDAGARRSEDPIFRSHGRRQGGCRLRRAS